MEIKRALLQARKEFGKPGYEINNGECEDFALRVISLLGGYSEGLTDGTPDFDSVYVGHYWIEYKGRYYDAECLEGVTNWRRLPIFLNSIELLR